MEVGRSRAASPLERLHRTLLPRPKPPRQAPASSSAHDAPRSISSPRSSRLAVARDPREANRRVDPVGPSDSRADRAVLQVVDGPDDRDLPALDLCGDPAAALRHLLGDESDVLFDGCREQLGARRARALRGLHGGRDRVGERRVLAGIGAAVDDLDRWSSRLRDIPRGRARAASGRRRRAQPRRRGTPIAPGPAMFPATPNDEEIAEALVEDDPRAGRGSSPRMPGTAAKGSASRGSRWRRSSESIPDAWACRGTKRRFPRMSRGEGGVGVGGRAVRPGAVGLQPRRSVPNPRRSRRPPRPDRRLRLGVGRGAAHRVVRPSRRRPSQDATGEGGTGAVARDPAPESRRAAGFPGSGAQVRILPGAPMRCRENGAILPR